MGDRSAAAQLTRLVGAGFTGLRRVGGDHGLGHYRLTLPDGRQAFAKITDQDGNAPVQPSALRGRPVGPTADRPPVPPDDPGSAEPWSAADDPSGLRAEAAGLRWLAEAGAVPVPAVLAADQGALVIEWLDAEPATPEAAAVFGRELARMHTCVAESFGAPWPGSIAGLPLPNEQAPAWPQWYAHRRLLPYARIGRDRGVLSAADTGLIESVAARVEAIAGPPEPPSRIHGDCWSGNLLWSRGRGWLIDPAAHGGHRETDLAMLGLFGAPHLSRIIGAYEEVAPLADGWRERVPLHRLHPLLVHVCLFGTAYRDAALSAARAVPG